MSEGARRILTDTVEATFADSVPATRSEEYYIPGGDIVLQVDDTIFRLHKYILGTYSGLFRDTFSTPGNDNKEGSTDAKSLRLPKELCSAQSFTALCKFMYPRKFGVFPQILVKDLDLWETVIQATQALQMADIQDHILSKLEEDKPDAALQVVRLLRLATSVSHKSLEFECLRTLAYRCRPVTQAEGAAIGGRAMAQVAFIREQIRVLLFTSSGGLQSGILLHNSCSERQSCQKAIFKAILAKAIAKPTTYPGQGDYNYDIFQIRHDHGYRVVKGGDCPEIVYNGFCTLCGPIMDELAASLKEAKLDKEIREFIYICTTQH